MSQQAAVAKPAAGPLETFGPELAQLIVVTMWASTFVVTKSTFSQITPLAFIFVRHILMVLLAFAVLAARRRPGDWHIKKSDLGLLVLVGLCGYTFYQLGFVLGLERTSPFSSSLLIAMVPFFTMIFLAIRGDRSPGVAWLGLAVAIGGMLIFLSEKIGVGEGSLIGDLLAIGAAVSFALYGIINRPLVKSYSAPTYTAYTLLAGSIPLILISTPDALAQDWLKVDFWGWAAVIYMVIFPVYIAYMFWNWAIARRGAAAATSFSLLVPVISGILAIFFANESFTPTKLIGAALVLGGLVLLRVAAARAKAAQAAH